MSSVVDICNLALAHLGDSASITSIDPPDQSAQAGHCASFYPLARDTCLSEHNWKFTMVRATLAQLATPPSFGWLYAYGLPADADTILSVHLPTDTSDQNPVAFETESLASGVAVLYTNISTAAIRYTRQIIDPAKFDSLFRDALTRLLASYLAGPVVKGSEGRAAAKEQYQMYASLLSRAKAADANQRLTKQTHLPAHIAGRSGILAVQLDNPPTT